MRLQNHHLSRDWRFSWSTFRKKNMSDNTICVYRYAVEQFYRLYPQLTSRNLQLYKVYLLEHYKPQTVNLRLRAINCFIEDKSSGLPCPHDTDPAENLAG